MTEIKSFEGNLNEITKIQIDFFKEADEFVYFRKGEFENIKDILSFVKDYLLEHPEIILLMVSKIAKKISNRIKKMKREEEKQLDFRIIAKEEGNTNELDEFQKLGGEVYIIPPEKSGKIRYFINEKEFCLFIRPDEHNHIFFGIRGNDKTMIDNLKKMFLNECEECSKKA